MRKFSAELIKRWWVPVVTVVLGLAVATLYVARKAPTYVSSAKMWEPEKMRLPEGELFSEDMATYLGTQTELLQSGKLRDLTLARLRAEHALAMNKDDQPLPVRIRVWQAAKSTIFVLEATSSDGAYVQAYLNDLMSVYLEEKKNQRKQASGTTLASITEQVQQWERELKGAQDVLTAFQRTNNMSILQEEGAVSGAYLARLQTQLSDLELEDRLLDASNGVALAIPFNAGSTNPANGTITGPDNAASSLIENQSAWKELALLKIERDKLSKFLRAKHPKIIKLNEDIEREETMMGMFREQDQQRLADARQAVKLRIENIKPLIKEWQGKVVEANGLIAENERLKSDVQRVQGFYDHLANLERNVGISREIDQEDIYVFESACPAARTFSEERGTLTQAIIGGLALGLGIVFLISIRDDRFASVNEINEKFGDAVVGQVPEMLEYKQNALVPLVENNDERHTYVEAYRSLRSALIFVPAEGDRPKLLLITSAVPNEGKSTIAANLARTLALGGARVVLVDADMRRGTLDKLMGLPRVPGLTEALQKPETIENIIQRDALRNLSFISRGSTCANPGDLFLSPNFDQVLTYLRQQFDYVLIDSSPVFAADDVTTLAPKVDGTLFVVRRGFSSARVVEQAIDLLSQRQARILGLIFNRANASARSYYYYNHAEYFSPARVA